MNLLLGFAPASKLYHAGNVGDANNALLTDADGQIALLIPAQAGIQI